MCGVAGVFDLDADPLELERHVAPMLDLLSHRGPDRTTTASAPGCALGATRLAIVDLEAGDQPFTDDRGVLAVYNGEIYNAPDLRRWLESRGHGRIRGSSDGAILPALYDELGAGFASALEGMFAVAIWDGRERRLTLARDPFGIKPLHVRRGNGTLAFASEIKALRGRFGADPVSMEAIASYLLWGHVPGGRTVHPAIDEVPPGCTWTIDASGVAQSRRWRPDPGRFHLATPDDAADAVRAELSRSVTAQLQADVPIASFLSGGVDSSAVATLAAAGLSDLSTYCLVFPDVERAGKRLDADLARVVADRIGSAHHEVPATGAELVAALPGVVAAFDQPFAGAISTYYLSAVVGRDFKVALTGDGADELFGSYLPHRMAAWLDAGAEPADGDAFALTGSGMALAGAATSAPSLRQEVALGGSPFRLSGLISDRVPRPSPAGADPDAAAGWSRGTHLRTVLDLERRRHLAEEVLPFVDRLSMAHSLELRPPFLTRTMADITAGLPSGWLIDRTGVKNVLRRAVAPLLPGAVVERGKEGFVQPTIEWLGGALHPWVRETLAPDRIAVHGLYSAEGVRSVVDGLGREPERYHRVAWILLMLQLWWETHVGAGVAAPS